MTRLLSMSRAKLNWVATAPSTVAFLLATIGPSVACMGGEPSKLNPLRGGEAPAAQQTAVSSMAVVTVRSAPNRVQDAALQVFSETHRPEALFATNDESSASPNGVQLLVGHTPSPANKALPAAGTRVVQVAGAFPFAGQDQNFVAPDQPAVVEPDVVVPPEPENQPPPAPVTQFRPISAINPFHDYAPDGEPCNDLCPKDPNCPSDDGEECPEEAPFYAMTPPTRCFAETHYLWTASNLYHNPLYFEDVSLERYGHVKCWCGVQNLVSLGKFGVQLVGLPYQLALDYPHSRRYALGYYQPGDCAPRLCYQVPLNERAAITAAVFYTGVGFIIPW